MKPAQIAAYAAQLQSQQQQPQPQPQPPTPIANPTPNQIHLVPSHPSYTEMITAAILWDNSQGKDSGSSKRAIAKFIDRVYTNLPPTHLALLTHHLKRLKNSGHLVMVKNSYQLPNFVHSSPSPTVPIRSSPISQPFQPPPQAQQPTPVTSSVTDLSATPKRKPGRPPKVHQPEPESQPQSGVQFQRYQIVSESAPGWGSSLVPVNGTASGKRPRGRPPKEWNQNKPEVTVPFAEPISQVEAVEPRQESNGRVQVNGSSMKRRGRPPKKQQLEQQNFHELVQPQTVYNQHVSVNDGEVVKRKRGRPAKANVGPRLGMGMTLGLGVGRGRGRPKKINNALGPVSDSVGKKRGWPRGKPRGKKFVGMTAANLAGVVKRRGRKQKESGSVVPETEKSVYSGKPRGRPRKNFMLVKHTSEQEQEMNKELLRKLEDMQSKIRDAVEVIRPYISDQSTPDALSALQQLEHLSTMAVTASTASRAIPVPTDVVAFTEPPVTTTSVLLPFSMNVPPVSVSSVTEPFSFENPQPVSWVPHGEGGL